MKNFLRAGILLLMAAVSLNTFVQQAQVQAQANAPGRPGMAEVLESVTPAVVNIAVRSQSAAPTNSNPLLNDPFFRRFFNVPEGQQSEPRMRETQSVGSGVIIDDNNGYILTNHHVVDKATEIMVILQDKRRVQAELVGSDAGTDIALLKVDADNLVAIPRSNSDTLRVGDFVMAIGNPFGLGQTVTTGLVSALGRSTGIIAEGYEDFIQTDASINPGNSGGALVDYNGELVGINSAILAPAGGNVGIGFAVPINMAMSVVDQLLEYGEVKRGMLGVTITDLTPDVVEALGLDVKEGAVVQSVTPDSAADRAGIAAGDVIIAIGDTRITGMSNLRNTIGLIRAGTEVDVVLVRDGKQQTLKATVGESQQVASAEPTPGRSALEGVQLSPLPSSHPSSGSVTGILVSGIDQNSRAFAAGLRVNDIITAVNRRPVATPAELQQFVEEQRGALALNIMRDNRPVFLILR